MEAQAILGNLRRPGIALGREGRDRTLDRGAPQRKDGRLDLYLGPQRFVSLGRGFIGKAVDSVAALVHGRAMFRIFRIELESSLQQRTRYRLSQLAELSPAWPIDPDDPQIDVLRHALDEPVGPAERRAATEDQPEGPGVNGHDRGERLDNMPILLHERGARKAEMLLDFEQLLKRGPIVQGQAPCRRSEDGGGSGPSRAPRD